MEKRIIALFSALAICLLSLPISAAAEITEDCSGSILQAGGFAAPLPQPAQTVKGEKTLADEIYEGLVNMEAKINLTVGELTPENINAVFSDVLNRHPELFYVGNEYSYSSAIPVSYIVPHYRYDETTCEERRVTYQEKLDELLSGVREDWTDFEKILYLHDTMAIRYRYDMTQEIHDAYRMLTENTGVCQSYTLVMMAALQKLGIENSFSLSNSMNHIWNLVKLNGRWYHLDVTWDDPITSAMNTYPTAPDYPGQAHHTYFLLSDEAIYDSAGHHDWEDDQDCSDTTYDSWAGHDVRTPFVPLGDLWYAFQGKTLKKAAHPVNFSGATALYTMSSSWPVHDKPGYVYQGPFSGLISYNGGLLFNTPSSLCFFDPATSAVSTVTTPDTNGEEIYGFTVSGTTVSYLLATDPSLNNPYTFGTYELIADSGYGYRFVFRDRTLTLIQGDTENLVLAAIYTDGKIEELTLLSQKNDSKVLNVPVGKTCRIFATTANFLPVCAAKTFS